MTEDTPRASPYWVLEWIAMVEEAISLGPEAAELMRARGCTGLDLLRLVDVTDYPVNYETPREGRRAYRRRLLANAKRLVAA